MRDSRISSKPASTLHSNSKAGTVQSRNIQPRQVVLSDSQGGGDNDSKVITSNSPRKSALKKASAPSHAGSAIPKKVHHSKTHRKSRTISPHSPRTGHKVRIQSAVFSSRRESQGPRRRKSKPPRTASENFGMTVDTVRSGTHWAWCALSRHHLSPCDEAREDDIDVPGCMRPELPRHSRWLWNFRRGDLHWSTTRRNPVELYYENALLDRDKFRHGVYGKRYTQYPNPATLAVPEMGRGIFQRAPSKILDRDEKTPRSHQELTIEDVKEVAERAVGQFYPTAFERRRFSQIPGINRFLLSMIEYFHHYFNERKVDELAKQNNCLVFDQEGRAERQQRMLDCKLEASRCYAKFILGKDMPFHHTNCGAFGSISASAADRQFWEAFYAFTIQVVWITFARPDATVIMREMGRVFRGLYFDPARREGVVPKYRMRDRRNALLGSFHSHAKQSRVDLRESEADNTQDMVSTNYLAMCVAISRVYGEYDCPPMPPKAIYALLNNRSTFVNLLMSEDFSRPKSDKHAADRSRIGILGHARDIFDNNLNPIDEPKEERYQALKFLGPISEREQVTRVAAVAPYLLQPTPPAPSDLEKFA